MAEDAARHPTRFVRLAATAIRDQASIFAYTADRWGTEQAEDYLDFLDEVMAMLAENPTAAAVVPN